MPRQETKTIPAEKKKLGLPNPKKHPRQQNNSGEFLFLFGQPPTKNEGLPALRVYTFVVHINVFHPSRISKRQKTFKA
jgi:hypothetical protein